MTRWLRPADSEVASTLARAARVFCFLDYDGTLAPLAPTPDAAAPLPGSATLLRALVEQCAVDLAIVSGRPIADVRRVLEVPGVYYVGVHGAELCAPDGPVHLANGVDAVRPAMSEIRRRLEQTVGTRTGILIEDKGVAVACHYRLASVVDAVAARAAVTAVVEDYQRRGAPITVSDGHAVREIRPAGVDKGTAVYTLLAVYAPDALPVYVGDDRTDEDAFATLASPAITIRVGTASESTHARYRVETPADVQVFLRGVLALRRRPHAEQLRGEEP
jgi:trehalose-phosphatase